MPALFAGGLCRVAVGFGAGVLLDALAGVAAAGAGVALFAGACVAAGAGVAAVFVDFLDFFVAGADSAALFPAVASSAEALFLERLFLDVVASEFEAPAASLEALFLDLLFFGEVAAESEASVFAGFFFLAFFFVASAWP